MRDLANSRAMLTPGGVVKISRAEVKLLLVLGPLATVSNRALERLVARVRKRAIGIGSAS